MWGVDGWEVKLKDGNTKKSGRIGQRRKSARSASVNAGIAPVNAENALERVPGFLLQKRLQVRKRWNLADRLDDEHIANLFKPLRKERRLCRPSTSI
jgi:hypothetical protein